MDYPRGHRIDRRWLDPSLYPETHRVQTRFQDLDTLGHINNVAMAAMFEAARVRFNHPMRAEFQTDTVRTMVAGQTLNYVAEAHSRPDLDFHIGVGHIGTSSWVVQVCAVQGDTPVLLAMATMVTTSGGKACPVPPGLRAMLEARRLRLPS